MDTSLETRSFKKLEEISSGPYALLVEGERKKREKLLMNRSKRDIWKGYKISKRCVRR